MQQQERIHRRKHRAQRALVHAAAATDKGRLAEMLGVDESMVGLVRVAEHRKACGMVLPRELSAIDDDAAQRRAVPAHELGQRVDDDVGAILLGAHHHRRRHGIVDDQRNMMPVRNLGHRLQIADIAGGISDCFAKQRARVLINQVFHVRRPVRCRKANLDALAWQDMGEQCVGRAVKLRHGDNVAADLSDARGGIIKRSLAGGHAECADAAFKLADPLLKYRAGGIADARVAESLHLEIEQSRAVFGAVEGVGGRLINRYGHCLGGGIRVEPAMNCDRFSFHNVKF